MGKNSKRKKQKRVERVRSGKAKKAAKALATASAIAGGTHAYAAPVRFDNPGHGEPGHFHWAVAPGDNTNFLDILAAAGDQPGTPFAASTLKHFYSGSYGSVSNNSAPIEVHTLETYFLNGLDAGAVIDSNLEWTADGYTVYPGYPSYLPEGKNTYLGVRFDTGSGNQYGWIGVVRTGVEVEAFAWGYETEAGVPIEAGAGGQIVPAASEWGLLSMGLSLLAAGTWVFRKKLPQPRPM